MSPKHAAEMNYLLDAGEYTKPRNELEYLIIYALVKCNGAHDALSLERARQELAKLVGDKNLDNFHIYQQHSNAFVVCIQWDNTMVFGCNNKKYDIQEVSLKDLIKRYALNTC
jgi:hypothetical protein